MGKNAVHDRVREILPWFLNDTLGEKEQRLVLRHLRKCRDCREERDDLQRLQREIAGDDQSLPDYRTSYRKLMARIEATDRRADAEASMEDARGFGSWVPLAGAAATLVLGIVFVGLLQPAETRRQPEFSTLTVPPSADQGVAHRVALTFGDDVGAQTIRTVLIEARSRLIRGPDETGTYIVDIKVPKNVSEAEFIRSVREIEGVAHAAFYDEDSDSAP